MATAGRALDYPGLLPSALLTPRLDGATAAPSDGRPGPRTGRDWFVDVLCVVLSVLGGAFLFVVEQTSRDVGMPLAVSTIDIACGVIGAVAIWFRRRWPVGV